jgi:hypothetical protein
MEPKKNTANKKRFFLTLLIFCAIPISTAVEAAELQSPRQNPALITEHNYSSRNFTNLPDESDNEVSENSILKQFRRKSISTRSGQIS